MLIYNIEFVCLMAVFYLHNPRFIIFPNIRRRAFDGASV